MRETNNTEAVVRYTQLLLKKDRYDEEAHLSLIAVLAEARRMGQARHYYQNYVRRMTEIGVAPRPMPNIGITRTSTRAGRYPLKGNHQQ